MATVISTRGFLPYILPHAPLVPAITAEFNLRLAAIEFCERTRCWRERFNQALTENGSIIVCPDYATVHAIERANWNTETPLTPCQFADLPPAYQSDPAGVPELITQIEPNMVVLYPFEPGNLDLILYLKPRSGRDFTRGGEPMEDYFNKVPDFLLTQHAESVAAGALARVLMMPDREWTDPGMASVYLDKFNQACDDNFSGNLTGQQRAPRRSRAQFL